MRAMKKKRIKSNQKVEGIKILIFFINFHLRISPSTHTHQYHSFLVHTASEAREEKFKIIAANRKQSGICQLSKMGRFGNIRAIRLICGKKLFS